MKKVAFHNLGCKVNSYELEFVQQKFTENDFRIVPFDQKADIYVINTCTVTNIADRKSRQMLHRAKSLNPDAVVVAMGCYVETSRNQAVEDAGIDVLIGNNEKGNAYEKIIEYVSSIDAAKDADGKSDIEPIDSVTDYDEFKLSFTTEHTRVHIKIQDGCNQFCSYCAIPLARGRVRSRKVEDIVTEVSGLVEKGYKEFVLTGIHLSSYGMENYNLEINSQNGNCDESGARGFSDFDKNTMLIDAIEAVANIDGVKRIRLGSLEPRIITKDFLKRLVATEKICPHFHLSLQSGSNTVLKRMNRRYTAEEFYEKAMLIREYFEHPAITTDVIAGFPGETEDEFLETKDYMNKVDFYEAHIFKYSRRKGTVADKLPGQLTDKEKSARSEVLISDANVRSRRFREYYIGKEVEALFEEAIKIDGEDYMVGHTREYVKVVLKGLDESRINTIQAVKGVKLIGDDILETVL